MNRRLLHWATGSMRKSSPWQERQVRRPRRPQLTVWRVSWAAALGGGTHAEPGRVTAEEAAWRPRRPQPDAEERAPGPGSDPEVGAHSAGVGQRPSGRVPGASGGARAALRFLSVPSPPWPSWLTLHSRSLLLCVRLVVEDVASLLFQSCLPASSGAPTETLEKSSRVSTNARSLCLGLTLLCLGHT